jgi:predicted Zn-dependent protease
LAKSSAPSRLMARSINISTCRGMPVAYASINAPVNAFAAIARRWPDSLGGLVGLANARYALGDYGGAVTALESATAVHPESAGAWHNLAFAYQEAHDPGRAREAAERALAAASEATREQLAASLQPLLAH